MAKKSRMNTARGLDFVLRISNNLENLFPYVATGEEMLRRIKTYRAYRQAAKYWGKANVFQHVVNEIQAYYFELN